MTARGADEENCIEGKGNALMLLMISGVLMELIRYNIFQIKFLGRSAVNIYTECNRAIKLIWIIKCNNIVLLKNLITV